MSCQQMTAMLGSLCFLLKPWLVIVELSLPKEKRWEASMLHNAAQACLRPAASDGIRLFQVWCMDDTRSQEWMCNVQFPESAANVPSLREELQGSDYTRRH